MKFSFVIVASLVATSSAYIIAATASSTIQLILDDMTKTGKQFTKINDAVNNFPQSGIQGAAEIHNHETKMHTLFEDMTTALNALPKPVSAANVKKIIDAYQSFIPAAIQSVNDIAAKAADFEALPAAAPSIKNDLITSNAICGNFNGGLQSLTPPALLNTLATMVSAIEVARDNALAAFS
ncbi:hypothetical protein GALMADRAFT_145945 [Galerina marginata CBS 339.88]|uniref:Hydrophobic surface binding protein n=1 Tax=Galerina marginata (strain CBS 339.88) TaxID=685588 RepID=A0A067SQ99_GALM3|nr:hypothetical protein GALMADRAFT_145945 [Galerina marginata CBS 339.88]